MIALLDAGMGVMEAARLRRRLGLRRGGTRRQPMVFIGRHHVFRVATFSTPPAIS